LSPQSPCLGLRLSTGDFPGDPVLPLGAEERCRLAGRPEAVVVVFGLEDDAARCRSRMEGRALHTSRVSVCRPTKPCGFGMFALFGDFNLWPKSGELHSRTISGPPSKSAPPPPGNEAFALPPPPLDDCANPRSPPTSSCSRSDDGPARARTGDTFWPGAGDSGRAPPGTQEPASAPAVAIAPPRSSPPPLRLRMASGDVRSLVGRMSRDSSATSYDVARNGDMLDFAPSFFWFLTGDTRGVVIFGSIAFVVDAPPARKCAL
jgi:hypothetical protein